MSGAQTQASLTYAPVTVLSLYTTFETEALLLSAYVLMRRPGRVSGGHRQVSRHVPFALLMTLFFEIVTPSTTLPVLMLPMLIPCPPVHELLEKMMFVPLLMAMQSS